MARGRRRTIQTHKQSVIVPPSEELREVLKALDEPSATSRKVVHTPTTALVAALRCPTNVDVI